MFHLTFSRILFALTCRFFKRSNLYLLKEILIWKEIKYNRLVTTDITQRIQVRLGANLSFSLSGTVSINHSRSFMRAS